MKRAKMTLINFKAYELFRAGNDSVDIAAKLKISEPEAVRALVKAREESRRDNSVSAVSSVYEPPVEIS